MNRTRLSGVVGLVLAAGVGLSTTTCSSGSGDKPAADGKVTITVNGLPPATEALKHQKFLDDVAEFERLNPNIKIVAHEGKMDPQTFAAKLAGGQLEDVFYVYFTDPASLIAKHQVADITKYANDIPETKQLKPELLRVFSDDNKKIYGLPAQNYSMGLLYNRSLFTKAGLDPNTPPKTWDEVREAAKKIAALGDGTVGYGDYSKSNTGGWHFTAELYSIGGSIATKTGGTWKASFNDALGKQVLQQLKDMRWTDNSMGSKQLLEWADLLQMMGSGKLGMYIATGDNIPTIVNQYKGDYKDYGLGAIPAGKGNLAGGEGYMFNAKDDATKIKAGLKWLQFEFTSPERSLKDIDWQSTNKQPVGLPEPFLWTGDAAKKQTDAEAQKANVPVANYTAFTAGNASVPLKLEPPNAQQIYAVLDVAMQKVLTDQNANIDSLLGDAEKQVNTILATVS
jgi:ABC-type glycerol-3-phosphate transport system substrate-binding protein